MITKAQAMSRKDFIQKFVYVNPVTKLDTNGRMIHHYTDIKLADKVIKWCANGKCKTWKTRPNEFKLPIKHGLYDYGYITHENAHLFEVA